MLLVQNTCIVKVHMSLHSVLYSMNGSPATEFNIYLYKAKSPCDIKVPLLPHPQDVLERWEVPPINEVNRKLERIDRAVRKQEEALEDLRYVSHPEVIVVVLCIIYMSIVYLTKVFDFACII